MKKPTRLAFLALFVVHLSAFAASTSWKGTVSKDWSRTANWTAGVPTVGLDAIMLLGEQLAGAAKPGLDLVEDQHHVVRGAELAHFWEII